MLYTAQCQNPLPLGASGSYICNASDFVPAGTLNHSSVGETLPPVQPKPFRMYAVPNVPLSRSGLDSMKLVVWASESPQQPLSEPTANASAADSADTSRIAGFIGMVLLEVAPLFVLLVIHADACEPWSSRPDSRMTLCPSIRHFKPRSGGAEGRAARRKSVGRRAFAGT